MKSPRDRYAYVRVCVCLTQALILCGLTALAVVSSARADAGGEGDNAAAPTQTGDIALAQALAFALEHSPQVAMFDWDIRAAEAEELQARVRPNPEVSFEIEDIRWQPGPSTRTRILGASRTPSSVTTDLSPVLTGGAPGLTFNSTSKTLEASRETEEGAHSGLAEATCTLRLSQLIELGGKRAKRIRLAARERELASWDYEAARADLCFAVAQAFFHVLEAQEKVAIAQENARVAEESLHAVSGRVLAGKVSPLDENRARVELTGATIALDSARGDLEAARVRLAATWGGATATFDQALGDLKDLRAPRPLDDLRARLVGNPDLARWTTELEQREAALQTKKASAAPDLTVTVGFRRAGVAGRTVHEGSLGADRTLGSVTSWAEPSRDHDDSVVLEFGLPLPIFDRKQGDIRAAQAMSAKAAEEQRAAQARVNAELTDGYHALANAYNQARKMEADVLPVSQETYEKTRKGFEAGKFGYLDVLDSQRTFIGARSQYIETLATYHLALADVERLTGEALHEAGKPETDSHEAHGE